MAETSLIIEARDIGSIGDFYQLLSRHVRHVDIKILCLRVVTSEDEWMFPREICHEVILRTIDGVRDIRLVWYVGRGLVTKEGCSRR